MLNSETEQAVPQHPSHVLGLTWRSGPHILMGVSFGIDMSILGLKVTKASPLIFDGRETAALSLSIVTQGGAVLWADWGISPRPIDVHNRPTSTMQVFGGVFVLGQASGQPPNLSRPSLPQTQVERRQQPPLGISEEASLSIASAPAIHNSVPNRFETAGWMRQSFRPP